MSASCRKAEAPRATPSSANDNAKKNGVTNLVQFRQEDLFKAKFADATVVTLYLLPDLNVKLRPRLLAELKFLNAEPTGTVGPLTRRAIRDYQRKAGLKETGEPNQALFEALKATRAKAGG